MSSMLENNVHAMGLGCQVDQVVYLTLVIIVLSPYIFMKTSSFCYHAKFMLYYCVASVIAIFCMPLFLLTPKDVGNSRRSTYATRHIAKLIGIEYELRDGEILAVERGGIIVSNHQSTLDILGLFNIWEVPNKVAAIARKEVFYVWPFGLAAWLAGVVFIDRTRPEEAYQTLRELARVTGADKTKIWIFAEGTRNKTANKTGKLLPFRRGAFKIAVECQVPIIPVVFSPYYFLNPEINYFGQGKITIKALPPIETKGLTEDDINDLIEKTTKAMQDAFTELYSEVVAKLPKTHPFFQN